jgi:S-DNA-T family DNA segregation ATPase FtsK/SpoIIIE
MPRTKKRTFPLRPRTPSRVKKRTTKKKGARGSAASSHAVHLRPELIGLGLSAFGLFAAVVLWAGWDGGFAGAWLEDGVGATIGAAAYVLPLACLAIGGLMLMRSALVSVKPFRLGLAVLTFGLMLLLGETHGGFLGRILSGVFGTLVGETGEIILGATAVTAGTLLLSGASAGAILRRSGSAVKSAAASKRPAKNERAPRHTAALPAETEAAPAKVIPLRPKPVVDAVQEFPDIVTTDPPPLLVKPHEPDEDHPSLFDVRPHSDYKLPDRSILTISPPAAGDSHELSERTAKALVQTLASFGVEATMVGHISGPRVTRFELQLAPGTKVSKVAALKDDLSYALATTEIRILAPIPGKQAVGVELPNPSPNLVTLGDIFDDMPVGASPLSVWLGKDISGQAVWADLARMPHLLIAGTTGSGKSGCINTMLTSILLRATPDDVRMILIDPKRIELNFYEAIPHLLTPVVSSPKEAQAVLANVVAEMERRYERMSIVRARNLPEANRALRKRGEEPMPYLLVVIDELADLMMVSPQAVEDAIIRLAQKSRAVGIHLVLATQRPSVDVITGMIKANVPSRVAFAVSSMTDSRVILDGSGAESLLGQGDMLFKPLGTSRLQRVQGAYVSEEEVALIVEQCRAQREQVLDESLLEAPEPVDGVQVVEGDEEFDPDEDPLLERAIEIVVQTQTASVSLLQRRLRVGYTRAGRLVDMLERRGIISGYEGSKPRRVLVEESDLPTVLAG